MRLDVVGMWWVARGVVGGCLMARRWQKMAEIALDSSKPGRTGCVKRGGERALDILWFLLG